MAWRPVFIQTLRQTGNVRLACHQAGVSRKEAYRQRERVPVFAAEWDDALEDAIDVLEAEARKRGMAVSDTLLIFLLKAHRPEKYRETIRQEHSGPDGAPMRFTIRIAGRQDDDSDTRALP